jgi:hypothetical protein
MYSDREQDREKDRDSVRKVVRDGRVKWEGEGRLERASEWEIAR